MVVIPILFLVAGLAISTVLSVPVYRTVRAKTTWIRHAGVVTGLVEDADNTVRLC